MTPSRRIVVIGHTDVGRRTCSLLSERGVETLHLNEPTDAELRQCLTPDIGGVAVLLHDDIRAMRYSLIVEKARPGIRLFVAMFDRTARAQLERVVPNCVVLSPASIAVPSMVASAMAPQHAAVRRASSTTARDWVGVDAPPAGGRATITPFCTDAVLRRRGLVGILRGQLHPYDSGSSVLLGGALGLLLVIAIDTLVGIRHESLIRALYDATRTTATISAPDLGEETGVLVWAIIAALLVMGLTAAFAAGIVHHLLSGRHVAIVGRRVIPRSGHVVITGMGQVGVRLAQELRALGIAVVGVERFPNAPALPMARDLGIPVIIGDATSRRVLRRAGVPNCIAVVAAGSEERDNIAVAVSTLGTDDSARVVIRAGTDDAIDETRSLFHIGSVVDVNGLTSAFVAQAMTAGTPYLAVEAGPATLTLDSDGIVTSSVTDTASYCACT